MKYSIISINEERAAHKKAIRELLPFEEVDVVSIDTSGFTEQDWRDQFYIAGIWPHDAELNDAEWGIWFSTYERWAWAASSGEPLLVFEDDAVLSKDFMIQFLNLYRELPPDWDYLALWVPENQVLDYLYDVEYTEDGHMEHLGPNRNSITSKYNCGRTYLSRVYQGYGNVATLYSPQGATKFISHATDKVHMPIDCWVHWHAHRGNVNGYAPKPPYRGIVEHDWNVATTIHK